MRLLVLLLVILITGCGKLSDSTNAQQHPNKPNHPFVNQYRQISDSAPNKPSQLASHNAKPIYEPLSRYGNRESYNVMGKSYRVLRTANGYKAKGIASWYGTKFHKYRTSSGEIYDMYAMTAAHKTLPLPSYVKVTNLSNGHQAIVRVNDRGPFYADRVIDLSYAAANKLGLMPKGTAPVEVEAITPDFAKGSQLAQYYVQAGAFDSKSAAAKLGQQITAKVHSPVVIEQYQSRFIVSLGPFAEKSLSDSIKNRLRIAGIDGAFTVLR